MRAHGEHPRSPAPRRRGSTTTLPITRRHLVSESLLAWADFSVCDDVHDVTANELFSVRRAYLSTRLFACWTLTSRSRKRLTGRRLLT